MLDIRRVVKFPLHRLGRYVIGGAIATYGNPVDHVDPGDGLHRPLAKRLTTLHILSAGRVIAGLGLGWSKDECDDMDTPFTQRGARVTDFVRALKECWLPDPVEYHGDFFDVPKCDNSPEPIRRNAAGEPQIEVAMGGGGNANGDEGKGSASEPLNGPFEGAQNPGHRREGYHVGTSRFETRRSGCSSSSW